MSKYTVLTITEDRAFAGALSEGLRSAGIELVATEPGPAAIERAQRAAPELVVVDDRLADEDPVEACRQMRSTLAGQRSFVMIVSPGEGASFELSPFVRSIVALAGMADRGTSSATAIYAHGLEMDRRRMRAAVDGRELRFTPTEFRLVWTLARKAGIVFSRQQLCDACHDSNTPVQARTIDVHIRTIRQKLGPRADLVETVRGVGYRFLDAGQPTSRGESTLTRAEQLLS
jgi:two-component system phosphate regulon response regulator PhoB